MSNPEWAAHEAALTRRFGAGAALVLTRLRRLFHDAVASLASTGGRFDELADLIHKADGLLQDLDPDTDDNGVLRESMHPIEREVRAKLAEVVPESDTVGDDEVSVSTLKMATALVQERNQLVTRCENLQIELAQARDALVKAQRSIDYHATDAHNKFNRLVSSQAEHARQLVQLQEQNLTLINQRDRYQQELESATRQLDTVTLQRNNLGAELHDLQAKLDAPVPMNPQWANDRVRIAELEIELKAKGEKIDELHAEVARRQSIIEAREKDLQQINQAIMRGRVKPVYPGSHGTVPKPEKCPKCKWCSEIATTVDGGWRCANCKWDSYHQAAEDAAKELVDDEMVAVFRDAAFHTYGFCDIAVGLKRVVEKYQLARKS